MNNKAMKMSHIVVYLNIFICRGVSWIVNYNIDTVSMLVERMTMEIVYAKYKYFI